MNKTKKILFLPVLLLISASPAMAQFGLQDSVVQMEKVNRDSGNQHNKGNYLYLIDEEESQEPVLEKEKPVSVKPKTVFVINSFSPRIIWTRSCADSLTSQIKKLNYAYTVKNYNLNFDLSGSMQNAYARILSIIGENAGKKPDAVVVIGENAFLACNSSGVFTKEWNGVPVVALGVTRFIPDKSGNGAIGDYNSLPYRNRFFGVVSSVPVNENMRLITALMPQLKNIVLVECRHSMSEYCKNLFIDIAKTYKGLKFSSITKNESNADSVINAMLKTDKSTAYITDTWDYGAHGSSYSARGIDSLFTLKLKSPLFSLNSFPHANNYIVGGYNMSESILAAKGTEIINNIFNVRNYAAPSDLYTLKNGEYIINKMALIRFQLTKGIKKFYGVRYVNTFKSWFAVHYILGSIYMICVLVLLMLLWFYILRKNKNKANKKETAADKIIFDKFNALYEESELNFAIYDGSGNKQFDVIKTSNEETGKAIRKYLPKNIYTPGIFTEEDISSIRDKKNVIKEINAPKRIAFMVSPVKGEIDQAYKYLLVATDITSEIEEIEQKERLDSLVDYAISTTDIGIACYNAVSGEGYATQFWFSNLGETPNMDGLIRPSYSELSDADKAAIIDFKQRLLRGTAGSLTRDIRLRDESGEKKWIRESIFLKETSANAGPTVIDINFNITAEKQKEVSVEKKVKRAERTAYDSDKFTNTISHEIRTPITSIVGFSKMLVNVKDDEEKENISKIITKNNNLLIEMFNNILSIAKIDSGMFEFKKDRIQLNGMFRELKTATVHMMHTKQELNSKSVEIIAEIPLEDRTIITDEWNLRLIMVNLLSNAVKFTNDGTITFGYQPQDDGGTYFYVKDTGCGISPKDQERIFNRFEKFDNFTTGTGLGLSLCKSIVRFLNGDMGVISNEGEGATFWFVLKDLK